MIANERKLYFNFEPKGWRYWREGVPPNGAAIMAFTLDENNRYVRRWWLWPMNAFVDGVEAPLPQPECKLVQPVTIALNVAAFIYHPDNCTLPNKPKRLAERWQDYHNSRPRIVHYESALQWLKRFLS